MYLTILHSLIPNFLVNSLGLKAEINFQNKFGQCVVYHIRKTKLYILNCTSSKVVQEDGCHDGGNCEVEVAVSARDQ